MRKKASGGRRGWFLIDISLDTWVKERSGSMVFTLQPALTPCLLILLAICFTKMLIKHFGVPGTEEGGRGW